jgi:hypothetical protein
VRVSRFSIAYTPKLLLADPPASDSVRTLCTPSLLQIHAKDLQTNFGVYSNCPLVSGTRIAPAK